MLIERFYVPDVEASQSGLHEINMTRLGQFVALTGKNGAGKSRLLSILVGYTRTRIKHLPNLPSIRKNIADLAYAIEQHPTDQRTQQWKTPLKEHQQSLEQTTNRVIAPLDRSFSILQFVPKQLNLQDPRNLRKTELLGFSEKTRQPGVVGIEQGCLAYIQSVQDKFYEATHPETNIREDRQGEIAEDYRALRELVSNLLKSQITRTEDGNATVFGRPLADAALSDGQKVILQLAAALHAQKGRLDNTVFVLDEPENHLHPSALVEFLAILAKSATNSQIWLATHSLPLLSYVSAREPMSIWYMEDGKVGNAGRHPERVLHGLLGNEEQIAQLHAFTSLPAQFAAINFATESLVKPSVVSLTPNDPQVAQIAELIGTGDAYPQTTILDFGAGKGRLIAGLSELEELGKRPLAAVMNYLAFEPSPSDREVCLAAIHSSYGDDKKRLFSGREDFFSTIDERSVDTVVMCNVLHEISPADWLSIFSPESLILRSLKDTGHVLIVEDERIPTGEKAHHFGFLVLSTPHLKSLFAVKEGDVRDRRFLVSSKRDGRLRAHLISKELLERITSESRQKAIAELRATALDKMKTLRNSEPNYLTGQEYGFWTQQFANAALFLEQA